MKGLIKLLLHPVLLTKIVLTLIFVRRELSRGRFATLINSENGTTNQSTLQTLKQMRYADWALRIICSRWQHSSPCLCHSLVLYRLAGPGVILRISAQRNQDLATHASVVFDRNEFTLAESWRNQPVFAEFIKGQLA